MALNISSWLNKKANPNSGGETKLKMGNPLNYKGPPLFSIEERTIDTKPNTYYSPKKTEQIAVPYTGKNKIYIPQKSPIASANPYGMSLPQSTEQQLSDVTVNSKQTPITTTNVSGVNVPITPTYNPDISRSSAESQFIKSTSDYYLSQAQKAEQERLAAQAKQAEAPKTWKDWLTQSGNQNPLDFANQQYTNIGIDTAAYFADLKATTARIDALSKDLNDTIAARDKQITDVYGAGGSTDFQNNRIAQINRNANVLIGQKESNLNTESAILQLKQGNFEQARSFVKTAVDAYTAQLKTDLDMTMKFYDDNQTLIKDLGKEYDDAMTKQINTLSTGYALAREQKQQEIENNFKQQGLNIQWAQENRLSKGAEIATNGSSTTIYDSSLEGYLKQGMSPSQAAMTAVVDAGENLSEADKTKILRRAETLSKTIQPAQTGNNAGQLSDAVETTGMFGTIYNSIFGK